MKPREIDYKEMLEQEKRLIKFKEANFEACGYDASPSFLLWLLLCALFPPLFIAWLLWEWYCKLLRMTKIFFKELIFLLMRYNYSRLLFFLVFIFMVLFILANVFR